MKKVHLLAGFFILTSSFQGLAQNIQTDTLLHKIPSQFSNLSNSNLRMSFYNWRNLQQYNKDLTFIDLKVTPSLTPSYNLALRLSWWPQVTQLNNNQNNGYNVLTGFAEGFSTGLSAANNYYLKDTYHGEINKSFYSISSFFVGAGVGAILGLKDTRQPGY